MFTIIRDEDLVGGVFAGIYMLRENDDVYIGQADVGNGVKKRISCHRSNIKAGRHKYFSKDADVKFEILEICRDDISQEELSDLEEDYWRWATMVGFNLLNKNQTRATTHKVKDTTNMKLAQRGENNARCRLSDDQVREIRVLHSEGMKNVDIAEKYSISKNYVSRIVNGKKRGEVE